MLNSRGSRFTATASGFRGKPLHPSAAHLLPKLRCQFAEFLHPSSLKRLRILIPPTCVRLRYGQRRTESLGAFPGSLVSAASHPQRALVITPRLRSPDLPRNHAYTLEPGRPTPGSHNLLRPPIASYVGIGILTDFPSATRFRLTLGADSPCADERCAGNLGLSATRPFTLFIATHVSIRTSDASSSPLEPPSQAYGTLSYRIRNQSSGIRQQGSEVRDQYSAVMRRC